ncbi:aldo/keto reductase [Lactococcus hodotermopsidis]|uniref:Aldo/keto reductase n=1 Tax=Pseudolactococcus hodotermopsidis TaxID=2709157 RepID=A0A6A0B897_9LACT|nr:tyrosine-protein phosphatase [Lactococcus hodotermopsidis]GFH41600.1 aldo/keto reductase [Lactococcus hodotermopsidis]
MKTLVNFRDLGAYQTVDGRKIKPAKLLRSGQPVGLAENDKEKLVQDYQLRQIIDFRSSSEIAKKPVDSMNQVNYHNIDLMKDVETGNSSLGDLMRNGTVDEVDEAMLTVYGELVMNESAQKGYADFLAKIVAQETGAVLFHCFAGKDRTGVGSALVLSLLGVSYDDMMRDYLLTNVLRQADNAKMVAEAKAEGKNAEQLRALERIMSVDEMYIKETFTKIRDNFGTVQEFASQALDFNLNRQNDLKALLLQK